MYISLSFTVCYELDIRPGDADNDINTWNTCCVVLIRKIRSISILLVLASSLFMLIAMHLNVLMILGFFVFGSRSE